MWAALIAMNLLLTGCKDVPYDAPVDSDKDGYLPADGDCDDENSAINPATLEVCDQADNNCNGEADEGLTAVWVEDFDGDGHASNLESAKKQVTCSPSPGYSTLNDDCDDKDASKFPGAPEVCNGKDDDCNGIADDEQVWYEDLDGDGFGNDADGPTLGCLTGAWTLHKGDCDDNRADINIDAAEICDGATDEDCDGLVDDADPSLTDGSYWYVDHDGDGYGDETSQVIYACEMPTDQPRTLQGGDCKDANADAHPGGVETCADTIDINCDGFTGRTDHDGDGFGACDECDDGNKNVYPGALETCNGDDDDCDGQTDENTLGAPTWYADADGDGFGDPTTSLPACNAPAGYVTDDQDCDDTSVISYPGATEVCDHADNDCNGSADDVAIDQLNELYVDNDGDGYGTSSTGTFGCFDGNHTAVKNGDCDDTDPALSPATIWYPDVDQDGYGDLYNPRTQCVNPGNYILVGDDCDDQDVQVNLPSTWYLDGDGDGFGGVSFPVDACVQPVGYAPTSDDCDDNNPAILSAEPWYLDSDADGYGDPAIELYACSQPASYVADRADCNDRDATSFPSGVEVCDGADNDCDGAIDVNAADMVLFYADADGDGYGDSSAAIYDCTAPTGFVADATDCDDSSSVTYPNASERCDSADNDCDGTVDDNAIDATAWYSDADGDGYGTGSATYSCIAPAKTVNNKTDCNDTKATISPAATERCDGIDNNCDGSTDGSDSADATSYYKDLDADTYGDPSTELRSCSNPGGGRVTDGSDCNDGNSGIHPGVTDSWYDGLDSDCDGNDNPSVCDLVPGSTTVSYDSSCAYNATAAVWSVQTVWSSVGSITWSSNPTYTHIGSAPILAQLNDDDGDGVLSERDTPDIAFVGATVVGNGKAGCIRIVDGATLTELKSICTFSDTHSVNSTSSLAAADLDLDGTPEIVAVDTAGHVAAFEPDGSQKWLAGTKVLAASASSPISIADLNADANAEVLVGNYYYDSTGGARGTLSTDCIYSVPANIDETGEQEVVCGGAVYDVSGAARWTSSVTTGGFPAVADLDGDGDPEVVQSKNGVVYLYDGKAGTLLSSYTFAGSTSSGVPVIADFNGDGTVDIGVSLTTDYQILSYNLTSQQLTSIWSAGGGLGSLIYGSTAADLDGDGAMEVIYGDKANFHIWSVYRNTQLYSSSSYVGAAATLVSPIVVDYDGDGNAEILVAAGGSTGWDELKILHEANDGWGNAPLLWNQAWYSPATLNDDMTVPTSPVVSWLGDNVFHASVAPSGDPQGSPDLAVDLLGVCEDCTDASVNLYISVENLGAERAGSIVELAIYTLDSSGNRSASPVETAISSDAILPGDHLAPMVVNVPIVSIDVGGLEVVIDDDGTGNGRYNECDETNNSAFWNEAVCL